LIFLNTALFGELFNRGWGTAAGKDRRSARGFVMKTAVIKRSIVVDGHKTSVSLEDEFWDGLREVADRENVSLSTVVGQIDHDRTSCNLSSAIRVFVFNRLRTRKDAQVAKDTQDQPAAAVAAPPVAAD
jgi:predicted DNA-binding ribbon-helix-helix protein